MWSLLILSLPTKNGTARMRAWRSLKALGAAVLRDGVYLLPQQPALVQSLAAVATDVRASGGQARLLHVDAPEGDDFARLFDRSADYAVLLADIGALRRDAPRLADEALARRVAALGKRFNQVRGIDHLPGEATRQAEAAWADLQALQGRRGRSDEPHASGGAVQRRQRADHQGRLWATRRRPEVDRLASAWLIRRFIDPRARFLWLADARRCPAGALGFDFDGATFSHVGARVTFETLLAAFDLETPALLRLGALVHRLDVGGAPVPEADGVGRVLAGMQQALADDDQLFLAAAGVFEGLWTAFEREAAP